ncbi:MAG: hypothetical protein ABIQ51_13755, partial [Mesorhizobium sp.]
GNAKFRQKLRCFLGNRHLLSLSDPDAIIGLGIKPLSHVARVPKGTSGTVMAWHYSFQGKIATPAWSKPSADR